MRKKEIKTNINVKSLLIAAMLIFVVVLSACGSKDGIIKELSFAENTQKAYLYLRTVDGGREYCITLLPAEQQLDLMDEPNVYKTEFEPDIQYGDDTFLMVSQNPDDIRVVDFTTVNGIEVVYGTMVEAE